MARSWMSIVGGILLAARAAAAQPDPALDRLEHALPAGWSLLASDAELVIRHDRPCYVTGSHHPNASPVEARATPSPGGGPLVTIQLRYRLEPRWTPAQLAAARATNERIGAELRTLAAHYHPGTIHKSKGRPVPATPEEQARLDAYEAAHAQLTAKLVKLPRCSLGDASVFDGDDTYAQLMLEIDPPEVMTEAHHIVELMTQHCG